MSLRGKINNISGDFFSAVKGAASHGSVDPQGAVHGTRKIMGYVCKVHPLNDKADALRGTVDVQEFGYEQGEDKLDGAGYHKGVLCSAIQSNKNGAYMMPALYSDVMIVQDPISLDEYVVMCSHVDVIQMQSRSGVKIGVVETEAFDENDDDAPDMDDLKETGNAAYTEYSKSRIIHAIRTKDGNVVVAQSTNGFTISAKDSKVTIANDGSITISAKKVELVGGSLIHKGKANLDGQGGFCGIPVCPFTGAVHTGSTITGE